MSLGSRVPTHCVKCMDSASRHTGANIVKTFCGRDDFGKKTFIRLIALVPATVKINRAQDLSTIKYQNSCLIHA